MAEAKKQPDPDRLSIEEINKLSPEDQIGYYQELAAEQIQEAPSSIASAVMGFSSGMTFNSLDELANKLSSRVSGRPYEELQAITEREQELAKNEHPYLYGGFEALGTVAGAPGLAGAKVLNFVAKAPQWARKLTRASLFGAEAYTDAKMSGKQNQSAMETGLKTIFNLLGAGAINSIVKKVRSSSSNLDAAASAGWIGEQEKRLADKAKLRREAAETSYDKHREPVFEKVPRGDLVDEHGRPVMQEVMTGTKLPREHQKALNLKKQLIDKDLEDELSVLLSKNPSALKDLKQATLDAYLASQASFNKAPFISKAASGMARAPKSLFDASFSGPVFPAKFPVVSGAAGALPAPAYDLLGQAVSDSFSLYTGLKDTARDTLKDKGLLPSFLDGQQEAPAE